MEQIGIGFGCGKRAGRCAVKLLKGLARFCGELVSQRGMRPDVVVVVAPEGQRSAGIRWLTSGKVAPANWLPWIPQGIQDAKIVIPQACDND